MRDKNVKNRNIKNKKEKLKHSCSKFHLLQNLSS